MTLHYSMLIQWSDEDECYLVTLPEREQLYFQPITHSTTYLEAAMHAGFQGAEIPPHPDLSHDNGEEE